MKKNEKNISAKEETCTEGSRLQKENVNQERQKGNCPPSCKGQKIPVILIESRIKDSGLCIIKEAGHWAFAEKPGEVLAIIKSFLQVN